MNGKKKLQPNLENNVKKKEKKKKKKKKRIEKGVSQTQRDIHKKEKKRKLVLERAKGLTMGPSMCAYLQKCHHNTVSVT